jgi:hypothetical protein
MSFREIEGPLRDDPPMTAASKATIHVLDER